MDIWSADEAMAVLGLGTDPPANSVGGWMDATAAAEIPVGRALLTEVEEIHRDERWETFFRCIRGLILPDALDVGSSGTLLREAARLGLDGSQSKRAIVSAVATLTAVRVGLLDPREIFGEHPRERYEVLRVRERRLDRRAALDAAWASMKGFVRLVGASNS